MIFLFFFACYESLELNVTWSGYTFQRDVSGDMILMESEEATLEMLDLSGETLTTAEHPNDSAYWTFTLQDEWLEKEIAVRVDSPETTPMLWRGKTPNENAIWLNQSIFGHSLGYNTNFFAQISEFANIEDLSESEFCHLWGQPLNPENWANANIEITDGNGASMEVFAWSFDEQGILSDDISQKVDLFLAFNIVPGNVSLKVEGSDNMTTETIYPAQAGDLISAFYYILPATSD